MRLSARFLSSLRNGAWSVQAISQLRMKMTTKPSIVLSALDADRLAKLLDSLPERAFPGRDELEAELVRAEIVPPNEVPPDVVTMNSTVKFSIESSSKEFFLTLVYPKDVDPQGGTISVLAPVGSALLGLAKGDGIEWPNPGGGVLRVRIEDVLYQPERAGDFRR
jgi:regulator of nucleoside diphosphate kinase